MKKKTSYALCTLRERAYKINYKVEKGFQHCRNAVIYDKNGNRQSGYMVMNLEIGCYVPDSYNECYDFLWNLDDVNSFLRERYEARGLDW